VRERKGLEAVARDTRGPRINADALLALDDFLSQRAAEATERMRVTSIASEHQEPWLRLALARHAAQSGEVEVSWQLYSQMKPAFPASHEQVISVLESYSLTFLRPLKERGEAGAPVVSRGHPVIDAYLEVLAVAEIARTQPPTSSPVSAERSYQLLEFLESLERDVRAERFSDQTKLVIAKEVTTLLSAPLLEVIEPRVALARYTDWLEQHPLLRLDYEERLRWLRD
jgi:hypothetical protein